MMCLPCHDVRALSYCLYRVTYASRMESLIKYRITLMLHDYIVTNYWMIDELTIHVQCQCLFFHHVWRTTNFNANKSPR